MPSDELSPLSLYTLHICLSLSISFSLKLILPDMNIAIPTFFLCQLLGVLSSIPSLWSYFYLFSWVESPRGSIQFGFIFLINPATLPFNWQAQCTVRVTINRWGLSTLPFHLLLSDCSPSPLLLFLVFLSFYLVFSYHVFPLPLCDALCLCSRFITCCYHDGCVKHLTDKRVLFLMIDSLISLFIYSSSTLFLFPFWVFVLSNYPFYILDLLPNWSSCSYFFPIFLPLTFKL